MIEAIELSSTRRGRTTLERVSFDVYPGQVTALVGASGSGKSAVLRMMAELEPCRGRTLYGGRPYHALHPAIREVGLALDPDALHPRRTVAGHLALYCAAGGVPRSRIADVLEITGLSVQSAAKCGRLDVGQRQRLALAAALLGDPAALLLDEPRGLDEHGTAWFHALLRAYAAQGRTVLVAAAGPEALTGTVDHVIVLRRDEGTGRSRVVASRSAAEVFDTRRASVVIARSPQAARLAALLEDHGAELAAAGAGALEVRGLDRARIGELAHGAGICLHELAEVVQDDVFGWQATPRPKAGGSGPIVLGEEEIGLPGAADGGGDGDGDVEGVGVGVGDDSDGADAVDGAAESPDWQDSEVLEDSPARMWRSGVRLVTEPKSPAPDPEPGGNEDLDSTLVTVLDPVPDVLSDPMADPWPDPVPGPEAQAQPAEMEPSVPPNLGWDVGGDGDGIGGHGLSDGALSDGALSDGGLPDDGEGAAEQRGGVGEPDDVGDEAQPPVPFTVLAPWKAAVTAGERPEYAAQSAVPEFAGHGGQAGTAARPILTPEPLAPAGRNPQPPETVPWYAAPSVVTGAGPGPDGPDGLDGPATGAGETAGPGASGVRTSARFVPGSNVSVRGWFTPPDKRPAAAPNAAPSPTPSSTDPAASIETLEPEETQA